MISVVSPTSASHLTAGPEVPQLIRLISLVCLQCAWLRLALDATHQLLVVNWSVIQSCHVSLYDLVMSRHAMPRTLLSVTCIISKLITGNQLSSHDTCYNFFKQAVLQIIDFIAE